MNRSRLSVPLTHYRRNHQLQHALEMRRLPTPSEAALWAILRHRDALGFRTKRQMVIGPYIADFVVPSVRLVVEVDGSVHHGRELADERRDADLVLLGYSVLRITAWEVMRSPVHAARRVAAEVARLGARGA